MTPWTPAQWRERPAAQQPTYPDAEHLERSLAQLRQLPPLVTSLEILTLKRHLAEAAEGKLVEALSTGDANALVAAVVRGIEHTRDTLVGEMTGYGTI